MAELRTLVNDFLASQKGNLTAGQFCKSYGNMNQGNFSNWRNHPESFAEDEIPPAIKAGLEKWLAERGEEHEGDLFHTPKTSPEKPLKEEVVAAPKATVVANLFPDKPTTPAKQDQLLAVLASHGLRGQPALAASRQIQELLLPTNQLGGVYLITIDAIGGSPVALLDSKGRDSGYVLAKIGRADKYSSRFSQFLNLSYSVVFQINGPNTMEAELKKKLPPNFLSYFYNFESLQAVVKKLRLEGNPGATEWRVFRRTTVEAIERKWRSGELTALNWDELPLGERTLVREKEIAISLPWHRQPNQVNLYLY